MERNRAMAEGSGVAKLPPKWRNGSAGTNSAPPPTPRSFFSQPETSAHENKKKNNRLTERILEFSDFPSIDRIFIERLGQGNRLQTHLQFDFAGWI